MPDDIGMKVSVEGQGSAEEAQEQPSIEEAVEYGAGSHNTMEGLAEASDEEATGEVDEPQQGEDPEVDEAEEFLDEDGPVKSDGPIDESRTIDVPTLSESKRPGFDTSSTQPALSDSKDEGGVARSLSTGPQKNFGGVENEGVKMKPRPDMEAESRTGSYEVTGFTVSYEPKKGEGVTSVQIRDYFPDMETAMASVNGNKYLMPMTDGGYKIATITQGAPSISFEERQLYEYINGNWRKS